MCGSVWTCVQTGGSLVGSIIRLHSFGEFDCPHISVLSSGVAAVLAGPGEGGDISKNVSDVIL